MDNLTKKKRSWNMSLIRSKNTGPELKLRSILRKLGYRYRLHRKDLPGKPDIVLTKAKIAIMVHGCFWHQHKNCGRANIPKSNKRYWLPKISRNIERDKKNVKALKKLGWRVVTIWECELKEKEEAGGIVRRRIEK